jgi:predicted  nucleic acid-binding Zn-ribbon protein
MADTPLTEADLAAAAANIEFFTTRLRGLLALGEKAKQFASLLGAEREKRATLADLDKQATAVREVVATGDAAQARLDGINTEIERYLAQMQAARERIIDEAHLAAGGVIDAAHTDAAKVLADARTLVAAEAEQHAGEVRKAQGVIAALNGVIEAKKGEHEGIIAAISELRTRIGA